MTKYIYNIYIRQIYPSIYAPVTVNPCPPPPPSTMWGLVAFCLIGELGKLVISNHCSKANDSYCG